MFYTCKPKKVSIYINSAQRTIAQVKAETGCDAIINGGLFDGAFRPVCHLKANGRILVADKYKYWGYAWDVNNLTLTTDYANYDNYIACVCLVRNGQAEHLIYNADLGGARQRTAMGRYPDGRLWLYCDKTGKTPEQLQQIALDAGLESAIMLDGGGSTQGVFPSGTVTASRIVHNFICVWADDGDKPQKGGDKKMKVCLDPGHGTKEMNQSPDGTYIEHKFALDMANRIRGHLVRCGVDVKLTREDSSTPTLTERANIANAYKADLFISLHSNATGGSGWNDNTRGLCVYTYAAGGERHRAANILIDEMAKAGVQMFGAKLYHNTFAVLKYTNMPAYLIEYAFHTSRPDVELLLDNAHRDKLALATAKAICVFGGVKWVDAPTAPTKPVDGTIYRVQVGAFAVEQNAENLKAELEGKGYKPFIVKEEKA